MQQRIKGLKVIDESSEEEANEMPEIPSSIPFLPYVVSLETFFLNLFLTKSCRAVYVFFISVLLMILRAFCV